MAGDIVSGLLAGAVGTTALNAVTHLDMALRGRPGSSTPEQTVERMEELSGRSLPGSRSGAEHRRSALGALLGTAAGLGTGACYGAVRPWLASAPLPALAAGAGLAANVATTGPMTALGVTDPRTWPGASWLMDLVPHLAYGFATAVVFDRLSR